MLPILLTTSIKLFSSLSRVPGATWIEATKRKAPHKPLLLLAVLDLVHRGVIATPFIGITADLRSSWGQVPTMKVLGLRTDPQGCAYC